MGEASGVFSTRHDPPVDCYNLINHSWWLLLEETAIPRMPSHNLCHTCATLLLSRRVRPKIVSEMLGHSNITITLDIYSHVLPNLQEKAVSAMEDILVEGS